NRLQSRHHRARRVFAGDGEGTEQDDDELDSDHRLNDCMRGWRGTVEPVPAAGQGDAPSSPEPNRVASTETATIHHVERTLKSFVHSKAMAPTQGLPPRSAARSCPSGV